MSERHDAADRVRLERLLPAPAEFLHLMEFADADAQQRHVSSAAVGAFTSALYPICTTKPEFTDWLGID